MNDRLSPINKNLGEIAKLTGGRLEGDAAFVVEHPSTVQDAGPKDLAFLGNPKYADAAAASNAGCLFLPEAQKGLACKASNRIFVEDPQWAFAQVLGLLGEADPQLPAAVDSKAAVDPQARLCAGVGVGAFSIVEAGAEVGPNTKIGAQCYIGRNVKLGKDCRVYPQVVIRENCVIGDRVIIQPGAKVGGDGFGFSPDRKTGRLRKIPQVGNVLIGDDVEIGANVTIDRAMIGSTVVGPGTKIDNLVQVAHGVRTGRSCILVSQVGIAGSSELGDGVVLGGQVGLVGHIKLGDGVQVGAQSGIMSDVPAKTIMFGYPARPHRESFKLQALYGRLPEMHEAIKQIQKKLGLTPDKHAAPTESK